MAAQPIMARSVPMLVLVCAIVPGPPQTAGRAGIDRSPADLLVRNVRIVHGDGRVTPRATVIVRGGRIATIAPGTVGGGPAARREVDGTGRTLIPGLIDAHVHVTDASLPLFLRFGVTTVRDLHNAPAYILPLARDDTPGRPRIVAAGALLDGPGSAWIGARIVESVWDARAAVREQVGAGAGVIAVATRLSAALTDAVVREAGARGVPVAAQLGRTTALAAARAGVTSLEHAGSVATTAPDGGADASLPAADREFSWWRRDAHVWARADPVRLDDMTRMLRENGVVLVPTLAFYEAVARGAGVMVEHDADTADPKAGTIDSAADTVRLKAGTTETTVTADGREIQDSLAVLGRFVTRYVRLGGSVAAGTDAAPPLVAPGASLHRELQLYVAAGLTPAAALETATVRAASLLRIADRVGTVDVGKDADLVLLDADPLADITATLRVRLVVRAGIVVYER